MGTDNRPLSLAMRTFTNVISLAAWRQRSVWSWGRRTERQAVKTRTDSFQELCGEQKGCWDELQGAIEERKSLGRCLKDKHPVYADDREQVGIQKGDD